MKHIIKTLLTSKEAAIYLGCAPNTVKLSRSTGQLLSVKAPAYLKMGNKAIRYKLATLEAWLSQFEEQANTAQHAK